MAFERMPRYVQVDKESMLGRTTEGEKSHPSTDGVLADGPNTMMGPKGGDGSPGNCHPTVPGASSFCCSGGGERRGNASNNHRQ